MKLQLVTHDLADHRVLREPAREVSFPLDEEIRQFIEELRVFFSDLESPLGKPAGLAATQVGMPLRIAIIQVPPEAKRIRKEVYDTLPPTVLINPVYFPILEEGKNKDWEGCYSVTDKMGEVYRYTAIHYEACDGNGKTITGTARGFLARLIQHEVGHLNGELYIDLLSEDCRFGSLEKMLAIRREEMGNNKLNKK
ncbi:peptide deformylase [Aquicella lusitana]|uniref:Peptide deformylase n=1 Tax=Aquicella lusitana TaxID=254246 RepID=A0A370GHR8_9COXI|nr:peptide deformylase [Aquicella lusitana]RDI43345.1 peptide deformylase [Aquicella lusitana]VVC73495.1 Peptide deformylase [Aquicella lusitana]